MTIAIKEFERILIAEDLKISQIILEKHLRRLHPQFQIDTADSGVAALKLFQEKRYDLIFIDIQLPRMSGCQVLEQLKAINHNIPPIIAYTATAGYEAHQQFIDAGFTGYLPKPITQKSLRQLFSALGS